MTNATAFRGVDYRSPLDGDPRLETIAYSEGFVGYAIRGGAMVVMPQANPAWSAEKRGRYVARRDANLMGICPACGAKGPTVIAGLREVQRGSMEHAASCLVGALQL